MKDKIAEIFTKYTSTDAKHVLELHGNVYVIDPMDHYKIIEEIDQLYSACEEVPDLSVLDKSSKDDFINEFIEMTAKNVLSVFVSLGLKTHIAATVINNDESFEFIFRKKPTRPVVTEEAKERYEKALSYYENETYMNGETLNAVKQALLIASGYLFKK